MPAHGSSHHGTMNATCKDLLTLLIFPSGYFTEASNTAPFTAHTLPAYDREMAPPNPLLLTHSSIFSKLGCMCSDLLATGGMYCRNGGVCVMEMGGMYQLQKWGYVL